MIATLLLTLQGASPLDASFTCCRYFRASTSAQAVDSWLKGLDSAEQRAILSSLFAKYVSPVMTHCSRNFKTVTPVIPINQAQTVCKILEGLLSQVLSGLQCLRCCCLSSGWRRIAWLC